ncbi:MAG: hypothetical protein M1813_006874 [Trichoglossum hirsutum]|nr:MAG: hypothetical protein M1813_006874 [Trichoglossum hirsutum]
MTPLVRHKNNANTSNFQFSLRRWISELTFTPVLISSTTSKHPIVLPSIQPYRRIRPEPAGLPPLTSIHSFDLLYETETTSHSRLCLVTPPIHSLTRFIFVEPNGLLKPIQNRFCVATGCEPPFALHQQQLVHKVEVPFSDIDLKASTISAQPALSGTGRPAVAHLDFDFSPFPHLGAQEGNGRAIRSYRLIPSTLRIKKQTPSSEHFAGYYGREGYAGAYAGRTLQKSKMYKPNTLWTWSFLIVAFIQAAIVLGFEGFVFAKFQTSLKEGARGQPQSRTIPTYLTLFIFGFVYQLILVYDALRLKNTIQVIGLCVYNVGLLIYASVQMDQIRQAIINLRQMGYVNPGANIWGNCKPYLIAVPCVIALGTVLLSTVAWKLYDEFAWTIYKHISADLKMKKRYLTFQIYIALLKFDFFFFLGFTVQFVVIVLEVRDIEFALTIAVIPVTIAILVLAAFWTRRENQAGMIMIIFFYFAALAYFLFKLVRMYQPSRATAYKPARRSLTTFAVITVILIVLTIANAFACTLNFDKGLKPHITQKKMGNEEDKDPHTEMPSMAHGPVPSRMTID